MTTPSSSPPPAPGPFQEMLLKLEGYLEGVALDASMEAEEARLLRHWLLLHGRLLAKPPFDELGRLIESVLEDNRIEEEEWADMLWLCRSLTRDDGPGRRRIADDMRRLQGVLSGLMADGRISTEEVTALRAWLDDHGHMSGYWPYDEIVRLTGEVLRDGMLGIEEKEMLRGYFNDFALITAESEVDVSTSRLPSMLSGVLASDPRIVFHGRHFAFTGISERGAREKIVSAVRVRGGTYHREVAAGLDYLVVGRGVDDSWSFSCFGRKVEAAVRLRQSGLPLQIVAEADFWAATNAEPPRR